jgi:glycosyltransferase involved in cell wall biosynthesis
MSKIKQHTSTQVRLTSESHPNLVSVIIPNYNHAAYLPQAIDSVLAQTYKPVEIILVDDGSTDHSRQVAAAYGDQIRYIWQENQGLSVARNTGIRAARGEFVAVLDADDMYEPSFIGTLVAALDAEAEADAVYCGYQFVSAANRPLPQYARRVVSPEQLHETLVNGNFLVPLCLLIRKSVYHQVGLFDPAFQGCADWDVWLRIARQYKVIGIDKALVRYRVLPDSMSSDPAYMLADRLRVLQKHLEQNAANPIPKSECEQVAYGHAYLIAAVEYFQRQDLEQAYDCIRNMVKAAPVMLTELETFYELGLGDQPKGHRGHFASLNLEWSEQTIRTLLARLFREEPAAMPFYRIAHAQFHYALGLLYYGARQTGHARRHLWRSLTYLPPQARDRQWRMTFLKSLMPTRLVKLVRPKQSEN